MSSKLRTAMQLVGHDVKGGRPLGDLYTTPAGATLALLEKEDFQPREAWEVAVGLGHISQVLQGCGYHVTSTDVVDRGYPNTQILNFLDAQELLAPNIISNPPFELCTEFILKAHHLGASKVAFFLKVTALEGAERSTALEYTGLTRVLVFRNRVQTLRSNTPERGTGMMAFAWFVWERGYTGKPQIDWLRYEKADSKWNPPGDVPVDGDQLQFELY